MSTDVRESGTTVAVIEAIRERRSIRTFSEKPLAREAVSRLLQNAIWAPSPHNSQPWRFTVLFSEDDKARLAVAMAQRLREELRDDGLDEDTIARQTRRSEDRICGAPVAIVCSVVEEGFVAYRDGRRAHLESQMAMQSVGSVLQSLFLLAWAEGIGSCWMAAPMYCPDIVCDALGLPDSFQPQALALLGYPASPGKVRRRRPLAELVDLR